MSATALVSAGFVLGFGAGWFLLRQQIATFRTKLEHAQEVIDGKLPLSTYRPLRLKRGRAMLAGLGLLILGLVVAGIGTVLLLANIGTDVMSDGAPKVAPSSAHSGSVITVPPETTGTPFPSPPRPTTIQWNQVFGTSRAIDLVFALFLDGRGPDFKAVKLKNAFIQSGITGEIITMKIGSENPLNETFPISEANPVPPKGFIRLVAVMNPLAPNQGLPNKKFLDDWRKTWFHAVYEDDNPDDILFDEKIMESYFPEIAGPHVTRKSP